MRKSNNQKTVAWILLGGGLALAVGSPILAVSGDWSKPGDGYMVATIVGGASMLGSIPLFIAAHRNKRKAMNASTFFEIRQFTVPAIAGVSLHAVPTLTLHINF